jgi:hypothetical protein
MVQIRSRAGSDDESAAAQAMTVRPRQGLPSMTHRSRPRSATGLARLIVIAAILLSVSCSKPKPPPRNPAQVRAEIVRVLPKSVRDRQGWATDMVAAFAALKIDPSTENVCSALAVTEQESGFNIDPAVPGLPGIALAELDRRASEHGIPAFVVHAALKFSSPNGQTYADRIAAARTEQDLSRIYDDFIGSVPMGKRLLHGANPVHTGGPMQVSIAFAEQLARARPYPYPYPVTGSIRDEVFTRRGGLYFGVAHLLDYPTSYPRPLYRFADYNAGFYASRNAAFQHAASLASGIPIPLDGDLVGYGRSGHGVGTTETAVRSLAAAIDLSDAQIRRALDKGETFGFEQTRVYQRVFALAEQQQGQTLVRAMLPQISLASPKISRRLTTEWFAKRVDQRYRRCLAKASQ